MMQSFILSRLAPGVGFWLARVLPRSVAFKLAQFAADIMARQRSSTLVQGTRINQAVIRGKAIDDPSLDEDVREVFRNVAHGFVDFYKAVGHGKQAVLDACELADPFREALEGGIADPKGLIIVGSHMLGFDIFLLFLGLKGYPIQALSYANPKGSYSVQNELRRRFGVDLTPISVQSLRRAFQQLKAGKAVLTGVDRPGLGGEMLQFFRHPVRLPVGHARLAVRTQSPILLGVPYFVRPGVYRAELGGLFQPRMDLPEEQAVLVLAQEVMSAIEYHVKRQPGFWLMFYPLWPELAEDAS